MNGPSAGPAHPPTRDVAAAFGEMAAVRALAGGQGRTWVGSHVVMKAAQPVDQVRFVADVLSRSLRPAGLRLPRPIQVDGDWIVDGWWAYEWLPGNGAPHRVAEVVEISAALHRWLADAPRPTFAVDDVWGRAARDAWEDVSTPQSGPYRRQIDALIAYRQPMSPARGAQLIHTDLAFNVLFDPSAAPAVIDWTPMWYPPDWATAIVVVDALDTGDAGPELTTAKPTTSTWAQLLLRAELFRLLVKNRVWRSGTSIVDNKRFHARTVNLLCHLCETVSGNPRDY